jgi:hypothetical protein
MIPRISSEKAVESLSFAKPQRMHFASYTKTELPQPKPAAVISRLIERSRRSGTAQDYDMSKLLDTSFGERRPAGSSITWPAVDRIVTRPHRRPGEGEPESDTSQELVASSDLPSRAILPREDQNPM